jgi:hypothetical protein
LVIYSSRNNLIPGHIDMATDALDLRPRGTQSLRSSLSPLSDQLRGIFEHFQDIRKTVPEPASERFGNADFQERIYNAPRKLFLERAALRKKRKKDIKAQNDDRAVRMEAQQKAERDERIRLEKEQRELEQKKKAERDRLETAYNFALMELKIIAKELGEDPDEFLEIEDPALPARFKNGSKSSNVDWMQAKAHQMKLKAIQAQRSQTEQLQLKMNQVKRQLSEKRVVDRVAFRKKTMDNPKYEKNSAIVTTIIARDQAQKKAVQDQEEAAARALEALCKNAEDAFEEFKQEIREQCVAAKPAQKQQPMPGGILGYPPREQPPPEQPPEPQRQAPSSWVRKEQPPAPPPVQERPPEPEPIQAPKPGVYRPPTAADSPPKAGAYKPPGAGAYKPPGSGTYKPPGPGDAPPQRPPAPFRPQGPPQEAEKPKEPYRPQTGGTGAYKPPGGGGGGGTYRPPGKR